MSACLQRAADAEQLGAFSEFLQAFWRERDLPAEALFPFELALEEIFLNVVFHGQPSDGHQPSVEVRLDCEGKQVTMVILDDGARFDPLSLDTPDVNAPLENRPVGGLGIHLVRTMMDRVVWRNMDGRNELTLTRNVENA